MRRRYVLNFLLVEGERDWCARCLEYDFVTQAATLQGLLYELPRTVIGHLLISHRTGRRPFEGLQRAAPRYRRMFRRSRVKVQAPTRWKAIPRARARNIPTPELNELRVAEVN